MASCFWDEKSEETFYYSSFPRIQGRMLRGAIKYLEALQKNDVLDKAALLTAGVPFSQEAPIDDASLEKAFRPALSDALLVLCGWLREPNEAEGGMYSRMFGGGGMGKSAVIESKYPLTEMLNAPFYIEKVAELGGVCPESFVKLGLEAVYVCLEVSEERLEIGHEASKVMVGMLDRLEPYADWEGCGGGDVEDSDEEDSEEEASEKKPQRTTAQQLRAVFAACADNPESSVVC